MDHKRRSRNRTSTVGFSSSYPYDETGRGDDPNRQHTRLRKSQKRVDVSSVVGMVLDGRTMHI